MDYHYNNQTANDLVRQLPTLDTTPGGQITRINQLLPNSKDNYPPFFSREV